MGEQYRVVAQGCETFDRLPGTGSVQERAAHTLALIHGRHVRNVREVAFGHWRGLVGNRVSSTIEVR